MAAALFRPLSFNASSAEDSLCGLNLEGCSTASGSQYTSEFDSSTLSTVSSSPGGSQLHDFVSACSSLETANNSNKEGEQVQVSLQFKRLPRCRVDAAPAPELSLKRSINFTSASCAEKKEILLKLIATERDEGRSFSPTPHGFDDCCDDDRRGRSSPVPRAPTPWRAHSDGSAVTATLRNAVCDWLLEFQHAFGLSQNTVCVAVSYLDNYLSTKAVDAKFLQLVASCAIFIATKLHESDPINLNELIDITENGYTKEQFRAMEIEILTAVKWRVNPITPLDIAYSMISLCVDDMSEDEEKDIIDYTLAFLDLSMCEHSFLVFAPSVQAVAAIRCAFAMLCKGGVKSWEALERELGVHRYADLEMCQQGMLKYFYQSFPELKPSRSKANSPTGVADYMEMDVDDDDEEDEEDEFRELEFSNHLHPSPSPSIAMFQDCRLETPAPTVHVSYGEDAETGTHRAPTPFKTGLLSPMQMTCDAAPFRSQSPVLFSVACESTSGTSLPVRPIAEYASPALRPQALVPPATSMCPKYDL